MNQVDDSPNGDTIAFIEATRECFMMQSARESLTLFSQSSRIRADIEDAKKYNFKVCVVIREWSLMKAEMEFRCFVFKRKLNAISQYCYYQHFPNLLKRKKEVQFCIQNLFEEAIQKFPFDNAIVDIFVDDSKENLRAEIIEINPWFNDTSGCLFEWSNHNDNKIIKEGPFEFRTISSPLQSPYDCLPREWKEWFQKQRDERKTCILF
eukprot:TRINITY_DN3192_c1_g1_i2.p1 TRINITY_DN3192_c1_g1~~TRINITY_DN3192_c1_g1_i2.p1  ORF type:complete len:208 (-),score=57.38 TRINITY_DN3192_c1_g1_i2:19-642(-)